MPVLNNYTFKNVWAEDSTNISSFNDDEVKSGITYKAPVVSNQLNGVAQCLSRAMQFQQCMGGYYSSTQTYYKGNVVSIVRSDSGLAETLEFYRCLNESGIVNKPPLTGATQLDINGVTYFTGGVIDTTNWKRIDSKASNTITRNTLDCSTDKIRKFMQLSDISYTDGGDYSKKLEAELTFRVVNSSGYIAIVRVKFTADYVYNGSSYITPKDYFGFSVPTIDILEASAYSADGLKRTSFLNAEVTDASVLPDLFGFHFLTAYTTDINGNKTYALYLYACDNTSEITIEGYSNFTIYSAVTAQDALTIENICIVRNGGGARAYDKIGMLSENDAPAHRGYWAERGLFLLPDTASSKDDLFPRVKSGGQGLNVSLNVLQTQPSGLSPLYMLALMQNSVNATIRDHSGASTITKNSGSIYTTGSVGGLDGDSEVRAEGYKRFVTTSTTNTYNKATDFNEFLLNDSDLNAILNDGRGRIDNLYGGVFGVGSDIDFSYSATAATIDGLKMITSGNKFEFQLPIIQGALGNTGRYNIHNGHASSSNIVSSYSYNYFGFRNKFHTPTSQKTSQLNVVVNRFIQLY